MRDKVISFRIAFLVSVVVMCAVKADAKAMIEHDWTDIDSTKMAANWYAHATEN